MLFSSAKMCKVLECRSKRLPAPVDALWLRRTDISEPHNVSASASFWIHIGPFQIEPLMVSLRQLKATVCMLLGILLVAESRRNRFFAFPVL